MEISSYHDTTQATYEELKENELKARTQDECTLLMMKEKKRASTSSIWAALINRRHINAKTPLTSIRRSMSNLKNQGLIRKTSGKAEGPYGRPELIYEIAE